MIMVAAPKQPPATEAEVDVAATVLADINMMPSSKIGKDTDEDNSSVVSVRANPSTSLVVDDWRNDLDDKLLRNEMTMNM